MPTQKSESFRSGPDVGAPQAKAAFVKPQLIYHGAVVDLTKTFGGSLTPCEQRDQEDE